MSDDGNPWVLPLGFPLGVSYPRHKDGRIYESVNLDGDLREIVPASRRAVWRLAHGAWSIDAGNWGRSDVLAAALEDGVDDPEEALDLLISDGFIAQIERSDAAIEKFASEHSVHALLVGYGVGAELAGNRQMLGSIEHGLRFMVDRDVFDFWTWAQLEPDLHSAANVLVNRPAEITGREYRTATDFSRAAISIIQTLIARGALYLLRTSAAVDQSPTVAPEVRI